MEKIANQVINSSSHDVLSIGLSSITIVLLFLGNWFLAIFRKDVKDLQTTTKASDIEIAKQGKDIENLKDRLKERRHENRQSGSDKADL